MDTIQAHQEEATRYTTGGTIFPGKLRGIQQLANAQGVITVTALDHRGSLRQSLQRAMPERTIGYAEIVAKKLRMVRVFATLQCYFARPRLCGNAGSSWQR